MFAGVWRHGGRIWRGRRSFEVWRTAISDVNITYFTFVVAVVVDAAARVKNDDAATARTTRSDTRKALHEHTEALFHEVLRKCGSLVHEDTFGLSLVDCAILSVVSKSFRRIVTTNEC